MSLKHSVLDYISRVRARPVDAASPDLLKSLERGALESYEGSFYALNAPCAPKTWEQRIFMASANAQSSRVVFKFPYAVEIVGMSPIIEVVGAQALTVPTVNSIDVAIDMNNQNYVTSAQGITTGAASSQDGQFVTLTHLDNQGARLMRLRPQGESPELGFTFRWKQGANAYKDAIIGIGIFARAIDPTREKV